MNLYEAIRKLLDSKQDAGGKFVKVEKKYLKELKKHLDNQDEINRVTAIRDRRYSVAEGEFGNANLNKLGLPHNANVMDSDGWETDGDRLLKKIYYCTPDREDSCLAIFVVEFMENSLGVDNVHLNF